MTKTESQLQAILAKYGYVWTRSSLTSAGVGTHKASGYKVAFDLTTQEWFWYRGRGDSRKESHGLTRLDAHLKGVLWW
jgi:uncharacterized membrane protein